MFDVIIVGGGPAGLSASLVLGRCRRNVLLIDSGKPRNRAAVHLHGYLTRDGIAPLDLIAHGRSELELYPVTVRSGRVTEARCTADGHFAIVTDDGTQETARKLLLATGMTDELPAIAGLPELYGISIHHCPYCDGWEWRDAALAAYGNGEGAAGLAMLLKCWSDDVILCTNGQAELSETHRRQLTEHTIQLHEEVISRVEGSAGRLERIVFEGEGRSVRRDAIFFNTGQQQHSDLPAMLGCQFTEKGGVKTDERERTALPGLFVAGDAQREMQFAICAASEGAIAAVAINSELVAEQGRRPAADD